MSRKLIIMPDEYAEYWRNLLDVPPISILLCNIREELKDSKKEKDEILNNNNNL